MVEAGDANGNVRQISIIFTVDLCQRTVSGFTVCATSVDDLTPPDVDNDGVRDDMDMCIEPTLEEVIPLLVVLHQDCFLGHTFWFMQWVV